MTDPRRFGAHHRRLPRAGGTPVGAVDALIATTSAQHGLAVATRNGRGFAQLGVAVVDPWTVAEP